MLGEGDYRGWREEGGECSERWKACAVVILDYLVTTAIQYVILFSTAALTTGPMGADSNIGTRRTNTLHGTAWHGTGQEIKPRHYTASRTKAGYTVNTMRVLSAQPVGSCTFRHGCYLGQVVSPMSAPCLETRAEYDA